MDKKIGVIICARNEERYIDRCLESLERQRRKPDRVLVVDDMSSDHTAGISRCYGADVIQSNHQRDPTRGVNTALALRKGVKELDSLGDFDLVLTLDADIILPVTYLLLCEHHLDRDTGLISGFSTVEPYRSQDVPNGARLYRRELLDYVPAIPGFDSYLKYKVKQLGYEVKGLRLWFLEQRPRSNVNGLMRHYYWGLATNLINQPPLIAAVKTLRYLNHKPRGLCSLIYFASYLKHRYTANGYIEQVKQQDPEYYTFTDKYYRELIGRGVKKLIGGLHPWS